MSRGLKDDDGSYQTIAGRMVPIRSTAVDRSKLFLELCKGRVACLLINLACFILTPRCLPLLWLSRSAARVPCGCIYLTRNTS
jgi:hypothetical protein